LPANKMVKIVADLLPGAGVLGGIYTGLTASDSCYNLVVAGDMPFLNPALLRYQLEIVGGFDVVVPRLGWFIEPLHAVYTQDCLPYIKEEIESGRRNIRSFFSRVKVKYVESEEINRFDPRHLSFFNINNEEDLKNAREMVKKIGETDT
jgi:molybdopterin-guanine dinucleotide biosynthesis protein A